MVSRLTTVLDEINGDELLKRFPRVAKDYIDKWVADGALLTRYGDGDEIVYEITPETDQAILFYEQMGEQRQNTRGAESKLRTVIESLQWISERANPDREARILDLEKQIAALGDERIRLLAGDPMPSESPERLMEKYQFALDIAQQLLADFSRIRQLFLGVAQELAERYASADVSRGVILERAIHAHRDLHEGPLGKSFSGFREYLATEETRMKLFGLIKRMETIPALTDTVQRDRFLSRMPENLINEAKAVIDQTRRLSSDLRRMLDARAITARRESQEVLTALKSLAYSMADEPPVADLVEMSLPYANIDEAEHAMRFPWRAPDIVVPSGKSTPHPNDGLAEALLPVFQSSGNRD